VSAAERAPWLDAVLVAVPLLGLAHVIAGAVAPPGAESLGDSLAPLTGLGWIVRILLCASAVTAAVLGPGLVLRRRVSAPLDNVALVWVPGAVILAATGLVAWVLAPEIDSSLTSSVVLAALFAWLAWSALRAPAGSWFRPGEAAVCGLALLVLLVGVAKATWSPGPVGELYGPTVTRTLEPSDRPDSRISFNEVQLVAQGNGPYSAAGAGYYFPYTYSDRGPLAGLAAAPIVLSSGAEPPLEIPEQRWVPFDPQGFAAYRIALELLGATILLSAFGLLRAFAPFRVAWAGTALVALTPLIVHETYFTWPKLLAASFGVAALAALIGRRPGFAGVLLGLSYLAHPVGLFIALTVVASWLALALWGPGRACDAPALSRLRSSLPGIARAGAWMAVGLVGSLVLWRLVNGGHYSQGGYFDFLVHANALPDPSVGEWVSSRLRSLGNTLVPLRLPLWDRDAVLLNPLHTFSPRAPFVIPFFFQYWTSLPFGVGIVYFPAFLLGLWRFARRSAAVFVGAVALAFVVFAVYFGESVGGLTREGLQLWIVLALIAALLGHSVIDGGVSGPWARVVRVLVTLRGVEVLAMLLVPTVVTTRLLGHGPFVLTDVVALAAMVGGVAALMVISWRAFDPARLANADDKRRGAPLA
jgi:hypothetical protein